MNSNFLKKNDNFEIKYYSQYGEDYLLWNFFNYKEDGFFIEIGAFDGIHISNSYSFEQQGWNGICVEAHPDFFKLLVENRQLSTCLNYACVGSSSIKSTKFLAGEIGLYSGIPNPNLDMEKYYNFIGINHNTIKEIEVPCITLNAILEKHLQDSQSIDHISIDVEGSELDILKGFDINKYKPSVLIVEANNEEAKSSIVNYFSNFKEYTLSRETGPKVRKEGINLIFVRGKEQSDFLKSIPINCTVEYSMHPHGEKYSAISPYYEEHIIKKIKNLQVGKIKKRSLIQRIFLNLLNKNNVGK